MEKFRKSAALAALGAALAAGFAVSASAAMPDMVVPMGEVVGISVSAGGVMIAELSGIDTPEGRICPASDAGLREGDVITMVDGRQVKHSSDLIDALRQASSGSISVRFTRGGETMQRTVTPYKADGESFIGVWVRDSLSGIGTVTFYDPGSGVFGALGHSISDAETGETLPFDHGEIHPAAVSGITRGKSGSPGQLGGIPDLGTVSGEMLLNSPVGIFGYLGADSADASGALPVADRSEIRVGGASILSGADGEVKEYAVEITRLYPASDDGRSMMIRVTDERLLALTGGIVQGMSGSPIIQDGRLVGAVTHVLINDPAKGYGVCIGDMLRECEKLGIGQRDAA